VIMSASKSLALPPLQALHDKQIEIKRAVPRDQMSPPRGLPLPGRGAAAPPFLAYGRGAPYAGYPPYPQVCPCNLPAVHYMGHNLPPTNDAQPHTCPLCSLCRPHTDSRPRALGRQPTVLLDTVVGAALVPWAWAACQQGWAARSWAWVLACRVGHKLLSASI
jgi:hypothetical protein